ncbi:MAG: hypothetical protein U5N58_13870 [Actinomycetota bacterium]|nr:hypothetical protein [Actinomycetota bacterium]
MELAKGARKKSDTIIVAGGERNSELGVINGMVGSKITLASQTFWQHQCYLL